MLKKLYLVGAQTNKPGLGPTTLTKSPQVGLGVKISNSPGKNLPPAST